MSTHFRFAPALLTWFDQHGRKDLPWQHPRTPYAVWVSEVMLQQTQVKTVLKYFPRFTQTFADVRQLAQAPLDEVLHLWTGLGYYSRARNLHKAAQIICDTYQGEIPADDLQALQSLPGIGRSTAGAIKAISTGQHAVILDANVKRVLTRFHALAGWPGQAQIEKQLWEYAAMHTPHQRLPEYTQAMMDLGATLCTSRKPACPDCPLQSQCQAYAQGLTKQLPTPKPKKMLPERQAYGLQIVNAAQETLLLQRPNTGIWGGLWSLPEFTTLEAAQAWLHAQGLASSELNQVAHIRHTFTHFRLNLTVYRCQADARCLQVQDAVDQLWYAPTANNKIGLPTPIKNFLATCPTLI